MWEQCSILSRARDQRSNISGIQNMSCPPSRSASLRLSPPRNHHRSRRCRARTSSETEMPPAWFHMSGRSAARKWKWLCGTVGMTIWAGGKKKLLRAERSASNLSVYSASIWALLCHGGGFFPLFVTVIVCVPPQIMRITARACASAQNSRCEFWNFPTLPPPSHPHQACTQRAVCLVTYYDGLSTRIYSTTCRSRGRALQVDVRRIVGGEECKGFDPPSVPPGPARATLSPRLQYNSVAAAPAWTGGLQASLVKQAWLGAGSQ